MSGYVRMRRDLTMPIEPAPLPDGVSLVPFATAIAPQCLDLMTRVYGEVGLPPMPFDEWFGEVTSDPEYDPTLIWVAHQGSVVGFCQCWTTPFVKDLVIDRRWRRRGLGSALLTRAMQAFKLHGAGSVDLKTDIENGIARLLYLQLGFAVVERVDD